MSSVESEKYINYIEKPLTLLELGIVVPQIYFREHSKLRMTDCDQRLMEWNGKQTRVEKVNALVCEQYAVVGMTVNSKLVLFA